MIFLFPLANLNCTYSYLHINPTKTDINKGFLEIPNINLQPSTVSVIKRGRFFCEPHVFIPGDDERELLSAGFDPVLSLHVRHELCAVTIDSQDDVPWTKVTLGGFAAWCYLQVTFIHTHNPNTAKGEKKESLVITGVKLPVKEEKKESISVKSVTTEAKFNKSSCHLIDATLLLGRRHSLHIQKPKMTVGGEGPGRIL